MIKPVEDIVIYAGIKLMKCLSGYVSADPRATSKKMSEDVEAAIEGCNVIKKENIAKSMAATVMLKDNQTIRRSADITVQPVSLQNLFVDLCGRED